MKRHLLFLLFAAILIIAFYQPLKQLGVLSFHDELYSHIPLMPLLSLCFFYRGRKIIFAKVSYSFGIGLTLIAAVGIFCVAWFMPGTSLNQNDRLSLMALSALIVLIGGFTFFYGLNALKCASFPFLLLLFMVPLPGWAMEGMIRLLQKGSAEAASLLFTVLGVPMTRDGYVFHLPGLSIEVAEQCSGIRSTMALVITSVLAGYLFLHRGWTRMLLAASVVPLAILKNGVRIVVLSVLGVYLDERILQSDLHRKGGVLFFGFTLLLLWGLIVLLRRADKQYEVKG